MKLFATAAAAIAIAMAFASPASATKFKCNCQKDAKADLEAEDTQNLTCVSTYSSYNESSSVQESQLKIYVDSDNKVQTDNDARIRFRPRDDKCLTAVYDGNADTLRWTGVYCDNDSYKDIGPFNFEKQPTAYADDNVTPLPDRWTATYRGETDSKKYKGFLLFAKAGDGKKYMQAMCIEDK